MTILPTHTCFDDAMEVVNLLLKEGDAGRIDKARLVHGICLAPDGPLAGTPFAHAWVEDGTACIQAGMLNGEKVFFGVEREEYLRSMRVQASTSYTLLEACVQNLASFHFGPWEPAYLAIIRPGDRTIFSEDDHGRDGGSEQGPEAAS